MVGGQTWRCKRPPPSEWAPRRRALDGSDRRESRSPGDDRGSGHSDGYLSNGKNGLPERPKRERGLGQVSGPGEAVNFGPRRNGEVRRCGGRLWVHSLQRGALSDVEKGDPARRGFYHHGHSLHGAPRVAPGRCNADLKQVMDIDARRIAADDE